MDIWSAAITLFLIMDPLGNMPVFMSVLKTIEPRRRRIVLARELLFSLIIMFTFLFSGQAVFNFLNVR
jgi:multiple antibiotic resistance protein